MIRDAFVPKHAEWIIRQEKLIDARRKSYGGYVCVQMVGTTEAVNLVQSVPGVRSLLPEQPPARGHLKYLPKLPPKRVLARKAEIEDRESWKPTPLTDEEVAFMMGKRDKTLGERKKPAVDLKYGDLARITKGSFKDVVGIVKEVNKSDESDPKVTVEIKVLGYPVVKDFHSWQVAAG